MKLKYPHLPKTLGTIIQENYWSFYPSEPFRMLHFEMRYPVIKNSKDKVIQYSARFLDTHRGLWLNLNLCLFQQIINAISWFSDLFIKKYKFIHFWVKFKSYQLGKGCCLPILPQYFAHNLYNAFVAQW